MAKTRTRGRPSGKNAESRKTSPLSQPGPAVDIPLSPTTGKQAVRLAIAALAVLAWLGFLAYLALRNP